ncbi:hypothetical protein HN747_03955 [archaeon]|nr:hypothetical protein [archaeon]
MEQDFGEFIRSNTKLHEEHFDRCHESHQTGDIRVEAKAYDNYSQFLIDSIQIFQCRLSSFRASTHPRAPDLAECVEKIITKYSQIYQAVDDKQQKGIIGTSLQ